MVCAYVYRFLGSSLSLALLSLLLLLDLFVQSKVAILLQARQLHLLLLWQEDKLQHRCRPNPLFPWLFHLVGVAILRELQLSTLNQLLDHKLDGTLLVN